MSDPASVPRWLKSLPLAPEYHPTETEFADPIAFISRIEREASAFGICKIVPPLSKPSKRFVLSNLARSLAASHSSSPPSSAATRFTTRHQELGARKSAVHRHRQQVWQSGEFYTLDQFESKSKSFQKSSLGHFKEVTPLLIESLFWKAASEKPIYVEYANDVPGSGFAAPEEHFLYRKKRRKFGEQVRSSVEEGSAGWKLSNSPWNLQVIARAPGSLTKFMPDDVPGVTSPMVYIGMLFSWFAWHVEDHELHSLNFLHMGAPKTWYAVPGEYANTMEEVVRVEGYGGDLDRLEAFTMLGEKTTLLSPEVIVNAGIPCCRLVQNPGEFVVTFPRAYHIGFSHGFSCGEAANFATPQWLKVAKEAAVRRAAMNHLPMLSHQQLLYMLTVSFISRVPRALLSGVRSSRLSDRKREEREILVKKAFLNDMTNEINLLCTLLQKESTSCALLWEPDLLNPCTISHTFSSSFSLGVQGSGSAVRDDEGRGSSQLKREDSHLLNDKEDPSWELTHNPASIQCQTPSIEKDKNVPDARGISSVELLEILDAEEDDLPFGLNIDSGTLQCVACGILGYPFMAIMQPSEAATKELFSCTEESHKNLGKSGCFYIPSPPSSAAHNFGPGLGESMNRKINPDAGVVLSNAVVPISKPLSEIHSLHGVAHENTKWASSNGFNRPRIFCLQHALEVEELLQHKGGAHMLIICHSDYLKIKAYTPSIAEDVGMDFNITDIPLENVSPSDLNLINISIGDCEHEQHGEDWTSKLGVNLRYCVNLRKQSTSKQEWLTLALGRIFSDPFSLSGFSTLKWHSRRSRTPNKVAGVSIAKSHIDTNLKKCNVVEDTNFATKFKDYRSYRMKPNDMASKHHSCIAKDVQLDSSNRSLIVNVKDDYSAASYRHCLSEKAEDDHTKGLFTVPISASEDLQMHQRSWFPLRVSRANELADSENYENCRPCALVPVFESLDSLDICRGTNSPVEFLIEYKDVNSNNSDSQPNLLQPVAMNSEVQHEVEAFDETNSEREVCNNIESGLELTSQGAVNNARDLPDIPVPQEPNSLGNLGNFSLSANQSYVSALPSAELVVSMSAECHLEVNVFHFSQSEQQLVSNLSTADSLGKQDKEIANVEVSVEEVCKMDARVNHSSRSVEPIVSSLSTIGRCRMQQEEIPQLDVHIAVEPKMEGSVDPSLRPEMQLVNNLSTTDSCEMQRDLCTAEEPRDGHSLKSEGLLASNLSTADTYGMLEEEIPASENDLQNGEGGVQLELCILTVVPMIVSSEVQQDVSANETKINSKVNCVKPVVDSCSVNPADVTASEAKSSVVQKSVKNKGQFGESCSKNLNNMCIVQYVRRRTKRNQEEDQIAEKGNREEKQIAEKTKQYARRRTKRKQQEEQLTEEGKRKEQKTEKRKQEEEQITEKRKREEEEMTKSHHKRNRRFFCTGREEKHFPEGSQSHNDSFIRSPCEGLRRRISRVVTPEVDLQTLEHNRAKSKAKRSGKDKREESYECDIEGCRMKFRRKRDLQLHTQNQCAHTDCGKRFRSHKDLMRHQRVHDEGRPLKCPWEGCQMSFKWEWARTEHLRIHTGERPYQCTVAGCGLTFRYVSAFSKHRRKTDHYVSKLN